MLATGEQFPPVRMDATLLRADYTTDLAAAVLPVNLSAEHPFDRVRDQLVGFGFAVMRFPANVTPEDGIAAVATGLRLGEPYVPALYRRPDTKGFGRALTSIQFDESADHPGFATRSGQPWHVDGTLEQIGAIRTSVLFCVRSARSGGQTRLFNAIAAVDQLRREDPEAAVVLLDPAVLRRSTTILDEAQWTDGPAFAVDGDGDYVNRFSEGPNVRWTAPASRSDELDRALRFLRARAGDARYTTAVRLEPQQCLILRNDQVSHCRDEYVDDPEEPRKLVRALFLEAPA